MLSVLWRGHRIEVHADRELDGRRGGRHVDPVGMIALAIAGASTPSDIRDALDACPLGETHRAQLRLIDGQIEVRLLPR
jgi:hypothetical protein